MNGEMARCMIGLVCLLLAGCASTPTTGAPPVTHAPPAAPNPEATASASVQATPTPQPARPQPIYATPPTRGVPQPTPTDTTTPRPTATITATLSGPLSTSGPWLIARNWSYEGSEEYLWAANPDLSGLTRLVPEPVIAYAVRPMDTIGSGLTIAYAARSCQGCIDITLKIVTIPDGTPQTITPLYQAAANSRYATYNLEQALASSGLVWSPDGRTLAFVGVIGGQSVDLYTYSLDTGEIKWLSDGPNHAYDVEWSPDGRYIIYKGFDVIGMAGPNTQTIWSVPAGGGANISLVDTEPALFENRGPVVYGWLNPTQVLIGTTYFEARDTIQAVNIETGASDTIAYAQYEKAAYSPEHHTWLLARIDEGGTLGPALILCQGSDCKVVSSVGMSSVWWSSSYDAFFSLTWAEDKVLYKITPAGEINRLPVKLNEYFGLISSATESPDGTWWAWHGWDGSAGSTKVYVGDPLAQPRVLPVTPEANVHLITWSPDSQHLLLFGETNTYIASRPDFEPVLVTEGWTATDVTWVR